MARLAVFARTVLALNLGVGGPARGGRVQAGHQLLLGHVQKLRAELQHGRQQPVRLLRARLHAAARRLPIERCLAQRPERLGLLGDEEQVVSCR